jgi:hypothetical protein
VHGAQLCYKIIPCIKHWYYYNCILFILSLTD